MKNKIILKPVVVNGAWCVQYLDGSDADIYVREDMIKLAFNNDQYISFDPDSEVRRRVEKTNVDPDITVLTPVKEDMPERELDPIVSFIHNEAVNIKPTQLVMPDLKWKYLVRSAMRGKNIMMTGAAGCGKTMAAKMLVQALDRPHFYFNLGATQDPRGTLIGNTHFKKEDGTVFCESVFVKAIQTKDSIILLDEISRAHPEAWNILMTVLDQGQRYLRLDEHENAPTIPVAEGVTFIATANIGNEYTATRAMDRALVDRFVIMEMDALSKDEESGLLKKLHPGLDKSQCDSIAEIASITRADVRSENPKLTTSMSTRLSVELAGLLEDGFTLEEGAEVAIYPFFDADGGVDSERTFMKQLVQKYSAGTDKDIFNTESEPQATPF
jgi:MoxR-like ATPase